MTGHFTDLASNRRKVSNATSQEIFLLFSVWLGATDHDVDSVFRWTDGYIVNWVNWDTHHPVGGPNKACIGVVGSSNKWANYECTDTKKFFCETAKGNRFQMAHVNTKSSFSAPFFDLPMKLCTQQMVLHYKRVSLIRRYWFPEDF